MKRLWHALTRGHRSSGTGLFRLDHFDLGTEVALEKETCECGASRWEITRAAIEGLTRFMAGEW